MAKDFVINDMRTAALASQFRKEKRENRNHWKVITIRKGYENPDNVVTAALASQSHKSERIKLVGSG